jgi:hypothetical protein
MAWTRQRPTVSGYYWMRDAEGDYMAPGIVFVAVFMPGQDGMVRYVGTRDEDALSKVEAGAEWHGPIPCPEG